MAKEYTVLGITELTRADDTRGLVRFYRHRIKSAGGVVLTVDIDEQDFTPAKVEPVLRQAAENADAILKSGG